MKLDRNTATIMLLLALSVTAYGQPSWDVVRMAPGVYLNDMCMLDDGLHGWAVGGQSLAQQAFSVVFRTTDGGADWEQLDFPYSSQTVLDGVAFVDEMSGWVVGSGGRIFATIDGGDSWVSQNSGTSLDFRSVHFLDTQNGWITGESGGGNTHPVFRTTDGGATWQDLSFGTTCYANDCIFFADELLGWISGWDNTLNPHIHHTKDGGVTWTRQTTPVPSGAGTVARVQFADPMVGWATVSSIYQAPAGAILHTTNGGATWSVQGYTGLDYNYGLDV
ncbi:MAG: hypothetical protein GF355_11895 [Candidatus Eisenbacteria bacterium]|nr:hypothetical protein [Candidatus Eisenbacteria bacterium]